MARDVEGKRVTVIGAARSGIAAAALLADKGADVTLSDLRAQVPDAEVALVTSGALTVGSALLLRN